MFVRASSASPSYRRIAVGSGIVGLCMVTGLIAHRVGLIAADLEGLGLPEAQASGAQHRRAVAPIDVGCLSCVPAIVQAPAPLRRADIAPLIMPRAKPSVSEKPSVIPIVSSPGPVVGGAAPGDIEPVGLATDDAKFEPLDRHVSLTDGATDDDEDNRDDKEDNIVDQSDDSDGGERDCDDRGRESEVAENEHNDERDGDRDGGWRDGHGGEGGEGGEGHGGEGGEGGRGNHGG